MKIQRVTLAKKRASNRVCMFKQITNLITSVELFSSFTFSVPLKPLYMTAREQLQDQTKSY